MKVQICLFLAFTFLPLVNGYIPRMLNGRPRGGFLGSPGGPGRLPLTSSKLTTQEWFVQRLNHFDQADTRTWKQKYFVNTEFYKEGGPLFVSIGGEGKANPIWMTHGAWVNYAKTYTAHMVMVEHRYYGDSHPTANMSTDNLQYLSSEQALADLANIVSYFKVKLNGAKVIVFGGSYSGALAAWFRMKYPHLADGAIASSAPVLARLDFKEYLEVVTTSLKTSGPGASCTDSIRSATASVAKLITTPEGRTTLKDTFRLCTNIDYSSSKDVSNFFSSIANNFLGVVQYNKDNRAFEGAKDTWITMDTVCGLMTNTSLGSPIKRYAAVNAMMLKVYEEKCLDFNYSSMVADMTAVSWNSSAAEGGRQWVYQTCTEFAFFQSSDSVDQPFGSFFPLKFSTDQCADLYGPGFTVATIDAGVKRTNTNYGGLGLKVTRVLFPNGSVDPWHALSVLADLGPEARAIYIKGTAHCANMYPPSPQTDPQSLTDARAEISRTIGQWLLAQH